MIINSQSTNHVRNGDEFTWPLIVCRYYHNRRSLLSSFLTFRNPNLIESNCAMTMMMTRARRTSANCFFLLWAFAPLQTKNTVCKNCLVSFVRGMIRRMRCAFTDTNALLLRFAIEVCLSATYQTPTDRHKFKLVENNLNQFRWFVPARYKMRSYTTNICSFFACLTICGRERELSDHNEAFVLNLNDVYNRHFVCGVKTPCRLYQTNGRPANEKLDCFSIFVK